MLTLKWFKKLLSFRSARFNQCGVRFNGKELRGNWQQDEKGNWILNIVTIDENEDLNNSKNFKDGNL